MNNQIKYKLFPFILFFVIALFHTALSINFDFFNVIVNGQDMTQPLNPLIFLERSLFSWVNTFPWWVNSGITAHVFYATPIFILDYFLDDIILSINIFWWILHFLFLSSYFLLFKYLFKWSTKHWILWTFLVYYAINTINILQFATVYVDYASYIWIPLLFLGFLKFALDGKKSFILLFLFAEILLFRPTSVFLIANISIFIFFIFLLFQKQKNRKVIWRILILWFSSFLILLLPIWSLHLASQRFIDSSNFKQYTQSWLSRVYQDWFSLKQTLRLNGCWTCHHSKGKEFPNLVFYKYSWLYNSSPLYIIGSLIPIFIVILWFIQIKKFDYWFSRKRYFHITLLILCLIFLAKSINPPFVELNEWFRNLPWIWIFFRSWSKYFMFFIIPLIVFLWLHLVNKKKLYMYTAYFYIIIHVILIYIIHSPVWTYWKSWLPSSYDQITKELNQIWAIDNVLLLPIANHRLDWQMYFRDGYAGSDRLYALTNQPIIYSFSVFWSSDWYKNLFSNISQWWNRVDNYEALTDNMKKLWYSHILVEKNAISYPYIDLKSKVDRWEQIFKQMLQEDKWNLIYENEDFGLFKWIKNYSIFSAKDIKIKKNNSTNYDINISVDWDSKLNFLQSFHKWWWLYLEPYSEMDCNNAQEYQTGVIECESEKAFYTWWELGKIFESPIFQDSHKSIYWYANSWVLNSDYIKENYNENFYSENPDGSISIKVKLYFKPQSYFYIWLIVSATTLITIFLWLLISSIYIKKRRYD